MKMDYNAIKRTLERMTCDRFQKELTRKTKELVSKQVTSAVDDMFLKAFK